MVFTRESRIDVNNVESDFVCYKNKHPEVDEILAICSYAPLENENIYSEICDRPLTNEEKEKALNLAPWGYFVELAPGLTSSAIDQGQLDGRVHDDARNEIMLRMNMLWHIVQTYDLGSKWADLATNCGVIPLQLCRGRDIEVIGLDIGEGNIEKANFLKNLSGETGIYFASSDIFDFMNSSKDNEYDFISALGIFYHLSNPLELLMQMHRSSRSYVLVDTVIHNFEFSGWIQTVSRHVSMPELAHANDTRKIVELHPTYRGLIDSLYQVGFSEVIEILPSDAVLNAYPDTIYHSRNRRMLLAKK